MAGVLVWVLPRTIVRIHRARRCVEEQPSADPASEPEPLAS